MAQWLAFLVEKYSLLSYNHFRGLKQKTTVDALLLLQEKIYQAWKDKKVLSHITFDVKEVFSGIAVKVLIHCYRKCRVPEKMVFWIGKPQSQLMEKRQL